MTYEEQIQKNIELSEQFTLYAHEHPEVLEKIPEGAQLVLLPEDDPELFNENQKTIKRLTQAKATFVVVRMKPMERTVKTRVPLPNLQIIFAPTSS